MKDFVVADKFPVSDLNIDIRNNEQIIVCHNQATPRPNVLSEFFFFFMFCPPPFQYKSNCMPCLSSDTYLLSSLRSLPTRPSPQVAAQLRLPFSKPLFFKHSIPFQIIVLNIVLTLFIIGCLVGSVFFFLQTIIRCSAHTHTLTHKYTTDIPKFDFAQCCFNNNNNNKQTFIIIF